MTKKYDDFISDLQILLEKHGVGFQQVYEDILIVNTTDCKNIELDEFFIDDTEN